MASPSHTIGQKLAGPMTAFEVQQASTDRPLTMPALQSFRSHDCSDG